MVNGRDMAALAGRMTVLEEGDDVLIFIPIAGG
jgi:molybdopterin converting factor small subunit